MSHTLVDIPGLFFLSIGIIIYLFFSSPPYYDEHVIDGYSLTAFGSKTAYKNNGLRSLLPSLHNRSRLVHVNVLVRHGTRSPDMKFSQKMDKLRNQLQQLCALPGVDFSVKSCGKGNKVLLSPGVKEMEDFGRRLRDFVPEEFRNASNMLVISSDTERTIGSAKAFLSTYTDENVTIEEDFERIRFFADCNNYIATIRSNNMSKVEFYKFRDGEEMQRVLKEVVSDHGLEDLQLTTTDIANIYKTAAYEVSAMEEGSPLPGWIRLFRPEHLYVLEYLHDLKYWTKGNAFALSYEQVCPLWGAIMEDMLKAASQDRDTVIAERDGYNLNQEDSSSHRSVFWFGHAETLLPLVAKLDLFNESVPSEFGGGKHLSATDFQSRLQRLKLEDLPVANLFRSSHIIPFAGNIAFYLFYCPNNNEEPSLNDYCLEVRLNEQVVEIIPQAQGLSRPLRLPQVLAYFENCLPSVYNKSVLCDQPLSSPPSV